MQVAKSIVAGHYGYVAGKSDAEQGRQQAENAQRAVEKATKHKQAHPPVEQVVEGELLGRRSPSPDGAAYERPLRFAAGGDAYDAVSQRSRGATSDAQTTRALAAYAATDTLPATSSNATLIDFYA